MTVSAAPAQLPALVRTPGRQFGVYVHVPFCATRCGYCDFNTYTPGELDGASPDGWLAGAAHGTGARGGTDRPASRRDTVFVGGGTPSLLGGGRLAAVLDAVRENFALAADAEVTTEANPESTSPELFADLLAAGYTRVSLGMQSVSRHVLTVLDRVHSPGRAVAAARRGAGGGLRARQPRPHLRHTGGARRRSAALGRCGRRRGCGPCVCLRAGGRGRHRAGAPGTPRRGRRSRRRRAGRPLRAARRASGRRRFRVVRGVELEPSGRRVPSQPRLLERRRMVGRRARRARLRRLDPVVECETSHRVCECAGRKGVARRGFRANSTPTRRIPKT